MAEQVMSGALILFDGLDLSCSLNQVVLDHSADALDNTRLCDTTRKRVGGLKMSALGAAGFFEAAQPDASLFAASGVADKLITVGPSQTPGDLAYFMRALLGDFTPIAGGVGELAGFELEAGCSAGGLVRGTLMELRTETASGNGTIRQLGAVATGKRLSAGLHVLAASGSTPSLIVKVQSDDAVGFPSPTDRITFNSAAAVGSQFADLAGPITDDYWRIVWTIAGGTPSFKFAASLAVL